MSLTTLVVFLTMIALLIGYLASLGVRVGPPENRTTLSLEVSDINNIEVDSNVLLRGVPVGKVSGIDTSVETATVHFYIDGQYQVPVDSGVRLENLSALGETYIEFEPRSTGGPVFRSGQLITWVEQPASISDLGSSVGRVLHQLDPDQLSDVVDQADVGLPDPNRVLPNLTRASVLLRNTTATFKGQGRELLDNFQVLLRNAGFVGPSLAEGEAGIRDLGPILNTVWNDANGPIGMSLIPPDINQFSSFITRIQKFIDDRGTDIRVLGTATSANLKLIANALKNFDSSQILANLLATVPEDGSIDLHVPIPQELG